ncbi:hypothetical protein PWY87_15835 [Kribbella solani]|uniref:SAV_915 family protein n=1 Tax=Kribbella solani TaxID=236067 RepID=UPI0029A86E69|nr:SAV_915 family protein [Kribbella solani]MDX2972275.1 hypothetical protein [Kribbella solani]MDX3003160.1 hypothetical protein [Kribbella solani]
MSSRHLVVPVRCAGEIATLRVGRLPDGTRVGIAFSTPAGLRVAAGAQEWMRLSEDSLRELLVPLGVHRIQLDPTMVVVPVSAAAAS